MRLSLLRMLWIEVVNMVKTLFVSVVMVGGFLSPMFSQEFHPADQSEPRLVRYVEVNAGVAETPFGWFDVSPGLSGLMAQRKQGADSKFFFEYGYGVALPTLVTGRVGFGIDGWSKVNLSAGLRVFPTHGYLRLGMPFQTKHRLVELGLSLEKSGREINPTFRQLSFGSSRMLTVGLCVELD